MFGFVGLGRKGETRKISGIGQVTEARGFIVGPWKEGKKHGWMFRMSFRKQKRNNQCWKLSLFENDIENLEWIVSMRYPHTCIYHGQGTPFPRFGFQRHECNNHITDYRGDFNPGSDETWGVVEEAIWLGNEWVLDGGEEDTDDDLPLPAHIELRKEEFHQYEEEERLLRPLRKIEIQEVLRQIRVLNRSVLSRVISTFRTTQGLMLPDDIAWMIAGFCSARWISVPLKLQNYIENLSIDKN